MKKQSFDLVSILRAIYKRRLWILSVTVIAVIISVVFCSLRPKRYTSETIFLVKNPLLIDRNYIFKNANFENGQFFAVPDDIDNIKTIAKSNSILLHVIRACNLSAAYRISDKGKLIEKVRDNFKFVIEDTKSVELYYTDEDPRRAAAVVNGLREGIEKAFLDYFISTNKDIVTALQHETDLLADSIAIVKDSMKAIRARIGNYNQLLPSRGLHIGADNGKNTIENIAGLEEIQELAFMKDRMASDIANHKSLMNEYREIIANRIHAFYIVQEGDVPAGPSNPRMVIIVAASAITAFFFASVLILVIGFSGRVLERA